MYKTVFGFRTYTSSDKLELNNGKIQTNGKYDAYFVKDERCLFNCKSEQYYASIVSVQCQPDCLFDVNHDFITLLSSIERAI
jgi:hypothetical protein